MSINTRSFQLFSPFLQPIREAIRTYTALSRHCCLPPPVPRLQFTCMISVRTYVRTWAYIRALTSKSLLRGVRCTMCLSCWLRCVLCSCCLRSQESYYRIVDTDGSSISVGDSLRKQCRSILGKDCPKKAILAFPAILSKRGNLNLDLSLDLQRVTLQAIVMFHTRGSCILRHSCCCMLKIMHQFSIQQQYRPLLLILYGCTCRTMRPPYVTERFTAGCSLSSEQAKNMTSTCDNNVSVSIRTPQECKSARLIRTRTQPTTRYAVSCMIISGAHYSVFICCCGTYLPRAAWYCIPVLLSHSPHPTHMGTQQAKSSRKHIHIHLYICMMVSGHSWFVWV